ncbi:MAG: hypothetical protein ACKO7R_02420 [Pseudanabaena sp.]
MARKRRNSQLKRVMVREAPPLLFWVLILKDCYIGVKYRFVSPPSAGKQTYVPCLLEKRYIPTLLALVL